MNDNSIRELQKKEIEAVSGGSPGIQLITIIRYLASQPKKKIFSSISK